MSYGSAGPQFPPAVPTSVVSSTGKTRLQDALERAKQTGKPAVGQWMEFPGYSLARTVASLGSDWVLVDCEHGDIDDSAMYHAVGAIAASGSSPIVRIAAAEPFLIKRALDSGAHGIMVPMCETKAQAETIARASRYRSKDFAQGVRGTGGLFAPANFHLSAPAYMHHANVNITVIVQIESELGVANAQEIASVPGIDMLFIGPNDLCCSMGYFAFDHKNIPQVQEAAIIVRDAAKQEGKYAGYFCLSAEDAAQRAKMGFEFVNCGADIVAISAWMGSEMGKLNDLLSSNHTTNEISN